MLLFLYLGVDLDPEEKVGRWADGVVVSGSQTVSVFLWKRGNTIELTCLVQKETTSQYILITGSS